MLFGVHGVHTVEVRREERALLAAHAAAQLHDDVFPVVRVARQEQHAQLLIKPLLVRLRLPQLLLRHVAQLGIGEQLRRLGDGPLRAAIVLVALRDRLKLLLLLREPPQLLRVAVDLRHGQQLSDLRAAARDLFQLLPHCFSSPPSCSSSHCG